MIIVVGKVLVREGLVHAALAASLEHVARSRREPGCVSHAVHLDAENDNQLVFVEEWQDKAALLQHFRVPASHAFVQALTAMAAAAPSIRIFDAEQVRVP